MGDLLISDFYESRFYEQADPSEDFLMRYNSQVYDDHFSLHLAKYPILARTAKGAWIARGCRRRFVLSDARKRFAHPTRDEAWTSFCRRKERHRQILSGQLERVERICELMTKGRPS